MYLTQIDLFTAVKRQFMYKARAYSSMFAAMILAQAAAVFFSFAGTGGMAASSNPSASLALDYFQEIIMSYTIMWGLTFAVILTIKKGRDMDFTFVSNRLSSDLSNVLLLLSGAVWGGITATLASIAFRGIMFAIKGSGSIILEGFFLAPSAILTAMVSAVFYMLLFMSLGYLSGMLMQLSKVFVVLVPALLLFLLVTPVQDIKVIKNITDFFFREDSLPVFLLKTAAAASAGFFLSALLFCRMEVKKQ